MGTQVFRWKEENQRVDKSTSLLKNVKDIETAVQVRKLYLRPFFEVVSVFEGCA